MRVDGKQFSKPTFYVDTPSDLGETIEDLRRSRRLGVDTESNSLHAYDEQVCFVQVSNARANYIIDPLRLDDISAIGELMADPGIEKIFHGADYDVGLMRRDFGHEFANLFDTMTAAQYLNMEKIGMADLVEECFDVHLEKKYTKCDWARRPVSIDKMVYLCLDTQYLIGLRNWLHKKLRDKDLLEEAELEFQFLANRPPLERAYANQCMWDIKGSKSLEKKYLAYLYELFRWRDRQAKRRNIPPFKVLNNKTMLDLARNHPYDKRSMLQIKGITPNLWRHYGQYILNALRKAEKMPRDWTPPPQQKKKKSDNKRAIHYDDQDLADALKKWRQLRAAQEEINPLAVLPGHVLADICCLKPRTPAELETIEWLGAARIRKYSEEILQTVADNA